MTIERLTSLGKKSGQVVQVGFQMELDTYNEFSEMANRFGYGSRRLILETAIKEYLEKHRDK
jgi:hypothetical protein